MESPELPLRCPVTVLGSESDRDPAYEAKLLLCNCSATELDDTPLGRCGFYVRMWLASGRTSVLFIQRPVCKNGVLWLWYQISSAATTHDILAGG